MPLGLNLQTDLESFFADPGDDEAAAISGWGQVIFDFTTAIVPATTTQAAARAAFEAALVGFSASNAATAALISAFTAHAASLAGGMTPPGTPPPSPIVLAPVTGVLYSTHAAAAAAYAPVIDAWYRTGLSGVNPFPPWS